MDERARWAILSVVVVISSLHFVQGQPSTPPALPAGIEVQARGPIHEAYASPATEPVAPQPIRKKPPAPIEELPPEEKPDGNVLWISGYWAWDEERSDFLWVSGIWRSAPPGKQWVAGYWKEEGLDWQWVPGFWTGAAKMNENQQITYLPEPPNPPAVAMPPKPPADDAFYVPGCWVWKGNSYGWRAGYWGRVQPGYVWVPDHYRWTPSGYIFVPGYWDLTLKRRGILYAPVVIQPAVVQVGFTYTPTYAVRDTVIVDAMFVRPSVCHYYFGDYYGPRYSRLGYESCIVYSRRHYEPIVYYEVYERRRDPNWINVQVNLYNDRAAGRVPLPPRTLVQQQTVINNNYTLIAPVTQVAVTKNTTLVKIDNSTRVAARRQAMEVQQVALQRNTTERKVPPGSGTRQARVASFNLPKTQPVNSLQAKSSGSPGVTVGRPVVNPERKTAVIGNPTPTPLKTSKPTGNVNDTNWKASPLGRTTQPGHPLPPIKSNEGRIGQSPIPNPIGVKPTFPKIPVKKPQPQKKRIPPN